MEHADQPSPPHPEISRQRLDLPANESISFVIPVWNESASLELLHAEIADTAATLAAQWEIIFVDDGSNDASWDVIASLRQRDQRVRGLRFRRNFGKAAALAAGFAASVGDLVFTLDADLQDDPREIPRFIDAIRGGLDVVSGWKKVRLDPWHKTLPSRVFNSMVGWVTGVWLHDHNCGFKCYRREVLNEIQLYGEFHRFLPVLARARGFRVGEVVVRHRARQFGASKYGWERFARGFLDLLTIKFLTSFQNRPQHLLGGLGLAFFILGAMGLSWLAGVWSMNAAGVTAMLGWTAEPVGNRPLLTYSATSMLFGAQMLSIGLLAELVTARNHDPNRVYSVAERLGAATLKPEDSCGG